MNILVKFQKRLHHKKLNTDQKIYTKMLTTVSGEQKNGYYLLSIKKRYSCNLKSNSCNLE